jgi:hypothetical protein
VDAALLDLELAGLVRRTTAGVQAVGLPRGQGVSPTRPAPPAQPPEVAGGRSCARVEAEGSPREGTGAEGRPVPSPGPRGPPQTSPSAEVLERGGSGGDDGRDD